MILTIHTFFSLFVMQVCACETNPICPIPKTILSSKEQRHLELEMLTLLDIDKRPQKVSNKKLKYSTKYMLDLYKIISQERDNDNRLKRGSSASLGRLRQDEISKAEESDVIMTMTCVNRRSDGVGQRQKLEFSMASVPQSTRLVVGAELKLFQNKKMAQKLPYTMYVIYIYKAFQLAPKHIKMKKVGEKVTSTSFTGWLSIEISYVFNTWLEYRMRTQELYVSVQPYDMHNEKEIHPALIGIIFQNEHVETEPFIVAFLQADNMIRARLPRNANLQSKRIDFRDILALSDRCALHTLKVSFKDLGWNDWVMAPDGYITSFCQGTCNFALKHPTQATHHALVQSLMHMKHPKLFPRPSCAATETSQLSVLFKHNEDTILKNYKDMIVRSCGCQ